MPSWGKEGAAFKRRPNRKGKVSIGLEDSEVIDGINEGTRRNTDDRLVVKKRRIEDAKELAVGDGQGSLG